MSWISGSRALRRSLFLAGLALIWEAVARAGWYPEILFPSFSTVMRELLGWATSAELLRRAYVSLYLIAVGLGLAIVTAVAASALAMVSRTFAEMVDTLMAIMHPLPGIAILPVVLLWFGTGNQSIIMLIWFSACWPLIANIHAGLRAVPLTQIEVGRNLGLTGFQLVWAVLIPAALPHILTGLRVAWARAWQSSVAAEMVFGASGTEGGLGWYIYKKRFFMEIPGVFAGMLVIILIGLIVERLIFAAAENRTIRRWGMVLD